MFSSFARRALRRAPIAVVGGAGATLLSAQQSQQFQQAQFPVQCASVGVYPISVGTQFLKMYFAEFGSSGKINLHDGLTFEQAKHMLTAAGAKPTQCQEMWDLMDTDGSGTVDFCEIMCFFLDYGKGSLQEKGSLFFNACDIDHSGTVEAAELKDIIHHMMTMKKDTQGRESFMEWYPVLYAGIPETYVLHLKANELVADIFAVAGKANAKTITEKQFQVWLGRGGREVNRLIRLFGIDPLVRHVSSREPLARQNSSRDAK